MTQSHFLLNSDSAATPSSTPADRLGLTGFDGSVLTHPSTLPAAFVCFLVCSPACTEMTGEARTRRSRIELTFWAIVISGQCGARERGMPTELTSLRICASDWA